MNALAFRFTGSRLFALTALFVALAGCAVGPDYEKPTNNLTAAFNNASLLQQRVGETPAPSLDTWWTGFNDPELTLIIQRVLAQNLDLAVSMARVDQARAAAHEAGANRLPQGNLDAQAVRQHQSTNSALGEIGSAFPGYGRDQTLETIGAGASWETDLAGGLQRGEEAAVAEAQAATASHAGVRISVAAEAADAYFRVRGAQQRIELAQDQINIETNLLSLVQARMASGLATNREQAQAQALVLQARATVPPLRTELALQLNRLDVLMGTQPGTYAQELVASSQVFSVPTISDTSSPASLLRRRPDVIAAERRLAASNARIGEAVSEYYPKVSLAGLLGFESLKSGDLISAASFQPQAVIGLHWRLFDFGRVDAEVAQAKGANAEALAQYRQSMLRATEDVENAIVTLTELEQQRIEVDQEVAAHKIARGAAQDAYKGGAISLIEVLDEDRLLLTARDQLAQLHANDARAAVATFRALGGGWSQETLSAKN
ncbi:efflux transporter outer membrane subunit [Pseudomonas sp. CCI3.2]|uniref:efflux transporter outer membrane subunit n=1 Tax=unclassified Pseudomonas TaxID=196821 RepID=UPI002AC9725E|nr:MULTISPECIES: efflux transporter outer membrane subunit [unclassified Pseudomonas]MEB0080272.1 efflux transporter outer membrane subunit [Pseudomonas sp. MH10out]MEB0094159.1 efflux transporter outer membrane subunit [Pseudomonas sp. CCI4.2]MEB0103374.1 efflux transporter outer membrane subunit [Pseudomonas sp. CCI3.2]MEB0132729.1 efflux transporter outer membrane subunit [Pseudomonas sp. CCI2.4]MEB0159754.1 efflux transporter outer membrane subunit [Pseudomonas sp. AH2 (2023)]